MESRSPIDLSKGKLSNGQFTYVTLCDWREIRREGFVWLCNQPTVLGSRNMLIVQNEIGQVDVCFNDECDASMSYVE